MATQVIGDAIDGYGGDQTLEQGFHFRIVLSKPSPQEKRSSSSSSSSAAAAHGEGNIPETDHIPITPLDAATLSALLSRLPEPITADDDKDEADNRSGDAIYLIRNASIAPPAKSGMLLSTHFPPPPEERAEEPFDSSLLPDFSGQEEEQKEPPLQITRFTPTKSVVEQALTSLTLTFSQPMVALSSIANVEADTASLPISLSPHVDGSWRWLGTHTIQFQAKHRLPFSTAFTLTVAQGCKSSIGGTLKSTFFHAFSTLPPSVVQWAPDWTPKSLSPLFLLRFDQRISPPSVLSHIRLSVEGDPNPGAKFAGQDFELVEEAVAEKEWPDIIEKELAGTWVAFKLRKKLLEKSTSYVLCVPCGCPSAEGSLTSTEDWSTSFSTYGPLGIVSTYAYGEGIASKPCWNLAFSNVLDHTSVSKSVIHVSPNIEDFKVMHTQGSSSIVLRPILMPNTSYSVTLDASIKDVYGQHLDSSKATAAFEPIPLELADGFIMCPASMVILNPLTLCDPLISFTVFRFSSLRIQVFQVDVDDYSSPDLPSSNTRDYAQGKSCAVGKKVYDQEVELEAEGDEPHEHNVFLGNLLQHQDECLGQLLVIAEPTERAWMRCQSISSSYNDRDVVTVWVQCTQLSLDVFPDQVDGTYTVWVSSLESGAPISEATVKVGNHKQVTDEQGLAIILADGGNECEMIIVQKGKDTTFMPNIRIYHNDCDSFAWYVIDSRGLYKPTEEVHIKGYMRKLERKKGGCKQPVFAKGHVNYTVHDARRNKLTEGDVHLNEYGSFFFTFSIPDNANLGDATIDLDYMGEQEQESNYQHTVKVQEFRKPEFEITTTHWAPSSVLYSHPSRSSYVIASTSAMYYAGGPMTGAEVRWNIQPSQAKFAPPGQMHYRFGSHDSFCPWIWGYGSKRDSPVFYPSYELTGKTAMDGKHEVKIEFRGIEDCPSCISVSVQACVIDINNQVQEAATTFLVHPSFLYVGFKLNENFGRKGEEVRGEVIVCDVDGKLVKGVEVKVMISGQGKQENEDDAGLSVYEDVLDEHNVTIRSDEKPVEFLFIPRLGGAYCMVFSAVDGEHRRSESRLNNFLISGGYVAARPRNTEEFIPQDEAHVILNKDMYEAGETAVMLIQSPFWPAEGLLIMKCQDTHVGEKVRFCMRHSTHTVTALLDASWIPRVEVKVLLVGSASFTSSNDAAEGKQLPRPAFAVAQSSINISLSFHKLTVDISPMRAEESATPGGTIHVAAKVMKGDHGEVVGGAEISLIVVDEAILNLASYTLSDPLSALYPAQYCDTSSHHLRRHCLLPEYHLTRGMMFASKRARYSSRSYAECCFAMSSMPGGKLDTIKTRSNFNPLAAFIPFCITDGEGLAELKVELPDNLTRYRIWAVAATESQFGLAESSLTVELPVMIRPSAPRFLNPSDNALISVVLQNQTKHSLPLLVGMRVSDARLQADYTGYSLMLPGSQRVAVSFPVLAVDVGKACLQFVASTAAEENVPPFADASEVVVPIFTPVSSELFATYGDVAEQEVVVQPIKCPSDVFPRFGGMDVAISSTTLQSLTDALLYLYTYPFECNEQLASRIIGFLSLWEVLEAFKVKDMPSKEKMSCRLNADLQSLRDRQLSCGGWSWWTQKGNAKHQPFISLHVACALVKASRVEVLQVGTEMLEKALGYCADIEIYLGDEAQECSSCLRETKHALVAYALYIQALSNKDVGVEASALFKKASLTHLTLEACGWILSALGLAEEKKSDDIKVLLDHIKSSVIETGEYAHFKASYKDDGMSVMLHSDRRTDAILLEALLITEPSSTLCAKLAKGLQAHRKAGKWSSTQENCFVLVALNRFFAVYEKEEPNFTANVWMGEQWVASHTYTGRSIETKQARVPMSSLLLETKDKEMTQLILQKKGGGRLYYRIGLEYAPQDFRQKAVSYGFTILRTYEGVDSPLHVVHDTTTEVWKFKVGEKVRVKLTLGTMVNRYHVAMVDSLPAGCEPINSALERSGVEQQDSCVYPKQWWRLCWVEHENIRDERVEAFCSMLRPGQYEYSYVLRATCKGEFVIPPAKVQEMYTPENFGRCASEKVVIN